MVLYWSVDDEMEKKTPFSKPEEEVYLYTILLSSFALSLCFEDGSSTQSYIYEVTFLRTDLSSNPAYLNLHSANHILHSLVG